MLKQEQYRVFNNYFPKNLYNPVRVRVERAMAIPRIDLTSCYCFRGSSSHFKLGENIMRYQARSKRLHNNLNQRYFLIENGFQFDIYTKDLFWSEFKMAIKLENNKFFMIM